MIVNIGNSRQFFSVLLFSPYQLFFLRKISRKTLSTHFSSWSHAFLLKTQPLSVLESLKTGNFPHYLPVMEFFHSYLPVMEKTSNSTSLIFFVVFLQKILMVRGKQKRAFFSCYDFRQCFFSQIRFKILPKFLTVKFLIFKSNFFLSRQFWSMKFLQMRVSKSQKSQEPEGCEVFPIIPKRGERYVLKLFFLSRIFFLLNNYLRVFQQSVWREGCFLWAHHFSKAVIDRSPKKNGVDWKSFDSNRLSCNMA